MGTDGSDSGGVADLAPFDHPTIPLVVLFVIAGGLGIILALRNCCSRQLLPHHIQKRIARGNVNFAGFLRRRKGKEARDEEAAEAAPFIPHEEKPRQKVVAYGSIASTRLFDDLHAEMTKRKEKSGKPPKLPKVKKISILHNSLCTTVNKIEQSLPLHIRTHSTFPMLSLIIQDYVAFVRTTLIPVTTKFISLCDDLMSLQAMLASAPLEHKWQLVGATIEERVQGMGKFTEEVVRCAGELQVMANKSSKVINMMYEELRMSSVSQNVASESSKTEYVFHLLAIFDAFKKMSVILQFARDEMEATGIHLTQLQLLLANGKYDELAKAEVFQGAVVQALSADSKEQQQQAEAMAALATTQRKGSIAT